MSIMTRKSPYNNDLSVCILPSDVHVYVYIRLNDSVFISFLQTVNFNSSNNKKNI